MIKAVALISGGLDSILAAKVVQEQGVEVLPVYFKIPFCKNTPRQLTDSGLDKELQVVDAGEDILKLLRKPAHGFGANMNPCIDCKILMLTKARELMRQQGASFVITGEVLGQRPMSQNRRALEAIEKESGLEGLLLRPLCAKFLPETTPEKQGWLKRDKLFDFNGRSRKPQIELARKLNIQEYSQPAGGCLLTDPQFSRRLKDLMAHKELNADNTELLKLGRHFRLSPQAKLIIGRNELENGKLMELARVEDYLFMPVAEIAGPVSLGRGVFDDEALEISRGITARYCDLEGKTEVDLVCRYQDKEEVLKSLPLSEEKLKSL
ncbi:MAG: tRNA 4-thiouridine(8) synthase ThiI, partial [Candidatus Omnitrophica bacterium]|nr:tRNA 4-thiouridine(8) synthase ThiI [Candidatus Omnitrophota bacterium]